MPEKKVIGETEKNDRLDIFASNMYPSLSRAFVTKLIKDSRIMVGGKPAKPGYRLKKGDVVSTDFDVAELEVIEPIDLPIIYEDNDVVVVDKPQGVISHSRGRYWNEPSVASFIRQRTGQDGQRSGIVHRLDRATSGVMICSKNQETMKFLQKQFSQRKVEKEYHAVVKGHLKQKKAIIDMPIERNPKQPSTFRVGANGKPSITNYETVASNQDNDMLILKPMTGRTHQLRVHLSYVNHPILGDALYGGDKSDRLFLHASSLSLILPNETSPRIFSSPLPKQFKELVK